MDPTIFYSLIPITALLTVFGLPVVLVVVSKWFKLKEKEMQFDLEMRKTSGQALESRVRRLESVILTLDSELRSKIGAGPLREELMEAPAPQESVQPGPVQEAPFKVK